MPEADSVGRASRQPHPSRDTDSSSSRGMFRGFIPEHWAYRFYDNFLLEIPFSLKKLERLLFSAIKYERFIVSLAHGCPKLAALEIASFH